MIFSPKQVEYLARAIVNRLEDRGVVEFSDAEAGIDTVMKVLSDNFKTAEAIFIEARDRAARQNDGREPTDEEIDEEVRRIAATRNFVV
jgi:hypothetical protein